jgi:hypothetical protein
VLEAQVGAQQRVVGVGDIAGGEYVGVDGGQVLVDDDAVVGRQACGRGQLDIGEDAHADHDRISRHDVSVGQAHTGHLVGGADDLDHPAAGPQLDTVGAMQGRVSLSHLRAEDTQ